VLDGVGMVQARFFEELLKVVLVRSCLMLASARGLCGALDSRADCSLIDATVVASYGLLAVLFALLLSGLGGLLGTLNGEAG
jgi:hypothetical protein